jgi:hypothetical protein
MSIRITLCVVLALGWSGVLCRVDAADTQQRPIVGQNVMGDKSRSGPDGFTWAPVTRNQAPSGRAPGETHANAAGANLPAGQDPGAPASVAASDPGTRDVPSARKKP